MAGLGAAQPPSTDALGLLLVEYAKRVYNSQLQHLKVNHIHRFLLLLLMSQNFQILLSVLYSKK